MTLLELLYDELRFEERVQTYLHVLRAGRTPIVFPDTSSERRALAVARVDFQAEVELMLTCNGELL